MPIQFVGSSSAFSIDGQTAQVFLNNLTGGIDTAARTGDLVIISTGIGGTVDYTSSAYTVVADLYANDTHDANLFVRYVFMGATPLTSFSQGGTGNTATSMALVAHVFRGVSTAMPISPAVATATGINSFRANPPAVTPSFDNSWIYVVGAGSDATVGSFSTMGLSNFVAVSAADTSSISLGAGYRPDVSTTYDPPAFTNTATDTANGSWAAATLALVPTIDGVAEDSVSFLGQSGGRVVLEAAGLSDLSLSGASIASLADAPTEIRATLYNANGQPYPAGTPVFIYNEDGTLALATEVGQISGVMPNALLPLGDGEVAVRFANGDFQRRFIVVAPNVDASGLVTNVLTATQLSWTG